MNTEQEVLNDTLQHMKEVQANIERIIGELRIRGATHDLSKLDAEEFDAFVSTRPKFKKANYGSPEYQECVDAIKPAIDRHYRLNRHHTGHFENGIFDMNLIDLIEMVADWKAAARRSPNQTFQESLDKAFEKYTIGSQLALIMLNTFNSLGWTE